MFNKIFILGAGAIGSALGGLLSGKNDVTLVGSKTHVDTVSSSGLSVSGEIVASFHVQADTKIRQIPEKTLIILTTKAYDSERAIRGIRRFLRNDTVILVLQNGLGNEEIVRRVAGAKARVLRGVTTIAAEFFRPGQVGYWKGETAIAHDAPSIKVAQILNASMLKTTLSKDIEHEIWNKVVINSVVNPLTAIFRVRNREIGTRPLANARHHIVRECVQVGNAEGIAFPKGLEQSIDREILAYTNFSSMCQDILKRKKTEIDFLNGRIVELGRKHGVPTPVNETLVDFIKFLEVSNGLPRKD
jgi:2-dehydropantoate 2-reductase